MVTIQGNEIVKTISVSKRKGLRSKLLEVRVCYNSAKGLLNEEEDQWLATKLDVPVVETITLTKIEESQKTTKEAT